MAINNVSLVSQPDLAAQQSALERQRRMAEALQQQSLTPDQGQNVGGIYVPPSITQHAAKLAQALVAKRSFDEADKKQAGLVQQQRQRLADIITTSAPEGMFAEGSSEAKVEGPGFTPPKYKPEEKRKWEQLRAIYPDNPALGGKMLESLLAEDEYSTDPKYDQFGNAYVQSKRGKTKYIDGVKDRTKIINDNGTYRSEYDTTPQGFAPMNPNEPFAMGPNGPVPNMPYQEYATKKARAGAPSVSVKTDLKAAESIAGQVGPILTKSQEQAEGAVGQIDAADRVLKAVETNKLFTGPLASKRMAFAQLGDTLGIAGRDEQEKIANTRQAVRGLAELTLEGRKLMQGQGQVTNQESELAEKAISGNIDSMTPAELRIVANASRRVAQFKFAQHQKKVEKARSNPATSGIADYFNVDLRPSGGDIDSLLKKYGGR
ncbi:hypothetical protein [Massilia endophytica]|uniref:hypothetical protein n=1 Tax=Massilia endophytica TaxID=2899220 RepID=UPI001E29E669|nr:hypothetical protein [Massilia endophytica]UGQ44975.1 hypothetical protein LSQ66_14330 [Massilia endophytica]